MYDVELTTLLQQSLMAQVRYIDSCSLYSAEPNCLGMDDLQRLLSDPG